MGEIFENAAALMGSVYRYLGVGPLGSVCRPLGVVIVALALLIAMVGLGAVAAAQRVVLGAVFAGAYLYYRFGPNPHAAATDTPERQ